MSDRDYEALFESPIDDDAGVSRWDLLLGGVLIGVAVIALWLLFGPSSPGDDGGAVAVVSSTMSPSTLGPTTPSSTSRSTSTTQPTRTSTTEQPRDFVEELEALLDELVPIGEFSGVVLVAKGDEVVWVRTAGLADLDSETVVHAESRFNLGSMDKMFTAVSILQLMEEGLLSLADTVDDHLPEYPNGEFAAQVTIEQLLTHTSGLVVDVFNEEFGRDPHQYRTNEDYLPLFVDEPLRFSPGTQYGYSNAGYIILGLVIEELTGVNYDQYVHDHIFEPSGMSATGALDVEDDIDDLAIGYTTMDITGNDTGVMSDHRSLMPGRGSAAGGGYSTAGDLHRFRNALIEHRLLSPESLDLLLTGRVEIRDQASYALGFFDRTQAGERVVGHGGGAPGVCTWLSIYPDSVYTVVVLSNSDRGCMPVLDLLAINPPR